MYLEKNSVSNQPCLCVVAGHGVLWSRLSDGLDQEHQGQLSERGVDRLHLPRDSQGKCCRVIVSVLYLFSVSKQLL